MATVSPKKGWLQYPGPWLVGAALVIGAALDIFSPAPMPQPTPAPEAVATSYTDKKRIDFCWEEQARKSLTPEDARFTAKLCETLEEAYREQYGRYYTRLGKKQ